MAQYPVLSGKIRTALAPCRLGDWPTPLDTAHQLADAVGLSALWIKREDKSSSRYGGNKVRNLEFLLAGISRDTACVTVGGTGSTHCLATAVHARAQGAQAVLAQFQQPATASAERIALAAEREATVVVRVRSQAALPLALLRAWRHAGRLGKRRWIPGGGANARAVVGHVLAALELQSQLSQPPDAVVLPLGTGGTAAGVALGLAALGWPTQVVAVRVAPRVVANRWRAERLARAARRVLAAHGLVLPDPKPIVVVNGLGRGYGYPTRDGESARELAGRHGLNLDSTYGGKAFATLVTRDRVNFQRAVFWHTFAMP